MRGCPRSTNLWSSQADRLAVSRDPASGAVADPLDGKLCMRSRPWSCSYIADSPTWAAEFAGREVQQRSTATPVTLTGLPCLRLHRSVLTRARSTGMPRVRNEGGRGESPQFHPSQESCPRRAKTDSVSAAWVLGQ